MKFHKLAWGAVVVAAISAFSNEPGYLVAAAEEATTEETAAPTTEAYEIPDGAENFEFEAEVHRMLDIVVNSLYTNKDVFLRELISNASDALDKVRFMSLKDKQILKEKEEMEVQVEYDSEAKTLTIRDSGIGMTKEDLVTNLGTVARSGTTKFLEALADKDKTDDIGGMIGRFGVGFYSTFLVATRVTVASKHPESSTQYIWESTNGESSYHIFEDPRGNTLGRGTEITLHLKEDATEYANDDKLKELVGHYSEFITHPIRLRRVVTTTVEVEDDDEAETTTSEEGEEKEEDLQVGEEEDASDDADAEEKPKKTEEVTTFEWEEVNTNPAIWTRDKDEITDEEYQEFWKVVSKESYTDCSRWTHFNAEGNINFKSILYLPADIPNHYRFGNIDKVEGGLKLYVRKVLISDEFDLMPRYLGFIRGVVDSEDLPLNVNRETLQESKILKVIKKKLVRKALDMLKDFAKSPMPEKEPKEKAEAEIDADGNPIITEDEDEEEEEDQVHPYIEWYGKFSNNIKMGILDDDANRSKLAKLLRFKTSKSDGKLVSLDDYVSGMKEWQTDIYVLPGSSLEDAQKSPFLEKFKEKDVEVIYFVEPIDEYMVQQMREFDGKKFSTISSENVELQDEDKDLVKRREKAYKKQFKPLTKWLKKLYGASVMRISISKRLGSSPAIVSSGQYGHSANMERIMRAQAFQMGQDDFMMKAQKVMEINPRHPFMLKLLDGCPPEEEGDEPFKVSQEVEDAAWILLDMALMNGGFQIEDVKGHSKRMTRYLTSKLAVDSLDLVDEIDPPEEEEEAPDDIDLDGLDGLNMADFDMENLDLDGMM